MTFTDRMLSQKRPRLIDEVVLPRRQDYFPSPADWQDEVLYFLLVDRFSDGKEASRPLLDRQNLTAARPSIASWRWDQWAFSGAHRWQGGTLKGVESKLSYLKSLGVSTLWLSPVFKQRGHLDTYHGYGIQDFLEIDPHFGSRKDLVDLVDSAHQQGFRVILDIIFNHSGANWLYEGDVLTPAYKAWPGHYEDVIWRGENGQPISRIQGDDDAVWPEELQHKDSYTRAGLGDLAAGNISDPRAEHKRTDFFELRDFSLDNPRVLKDLIQCYKYWIALTDCDGFRIDTLKHVSFKEARYFCGAIKEFAANLGKQNFFLLGEVAGGDFAQERYVEVLDRNLNAALDIGQMRPNLEKLAKGKLHPKAYFQGFESSVIFGSHRNVGERHVSILDDHDHVAGEKLRFSSTAVSDHQITAGIAVQLFTLGIPCIYYGSEQAFAGPEVSERKWLPAWNGEEDFADRYLREAMFGPLHPRQAGLEGLQNGSSGQDDSLPGFGPFGTAGHHCFDPEHPAYLRIQAMTALRAVYPVLRHGRQYVRPTRIFRGQMFEFRGPGELLAWSRILDDEELVCIVNTHGTSERGGDVLVDSDLSTGLSVVLNSAEVASLSPRTHPEGSSLTVKKTRDGKAFVEIRQLGPSEVLLLSNHPVAVA